MEGRQCRQSDGFLQVFSICRSEAGRQKPVSAIGSDGAAAMVLREACCKGGRESRAFGTCLAKEGPSSFLLTGSRENMGSWKPPRIASPSQYWLPSLLPASPGLGMVLYTKDADTGQSPVCSLPFPAYLLLQVLLRRERMPRCVAGRDRYNRGPAHWITNS